MSLFDWNSVPREVMTPLLTRQVIHTPLFTVARLDMKAGAVVPVHSHHNEQITTVQSGCLRFLLDGGPVLVSGGQVMTLAAHEKHGVEVVADSVAVDFFTPRREDWISGDDAYLRKG